MQCFPRFRLPHELWAHATAPEMPLTCFCISDCCFSYCTCQFRQTATVGSSWHVVCDFFIHTDKSKGFYSESHSPNTHSVHTSRFPNYIFTCKPESYSQPALSLLNNCLFPFMDIGLMSSPWDAPCNLILFLTMTRRLSMTYLGIPIDLWWIQLYLYRR